MMAFINTLYNLWPSGDKVIPDLRDAMAAQAPVVFGKYGFSNNTIVAHFMAQISEECGAGLEVEEDLFYSAPRLMKVWPSRFPTLSSAQRYAGNPQLLANKVYNGRMGNRLGTDDGWNFRGRSGTQITGRFGYAAVAAKTGFDLLNHPELVNEPSNFLECSAADFVLCGCLPYAEKDDVVGVSSMLNVGHLASPSAIEGLVQREAWLQKWKSVLS